jgi:hypothetical protein
MAKNEIQFICNKRIYLTRCVIYLLSPGYMLIGRAVLYIRSRTLQKDRTHNSLMSGRINIKNAGRQGPWDGPEAPGGGGGGRGRNVYRGYT